MRGENVLDVQSLQSLTEPRSHGIRIQPDEPLRWTEGKSVLRSEQNVARHEGSVRREPKEHLIGAPGIDGENPARERFACAKDVRDRRALLDKLASRLVHPNPRSWVSLDKHRRASRVPEDRDQDVHRARCPGHVVVESFKEARRILRRDERIDQRDRILRFLVETADLLSPFHLGGPLRVKSGPTPETRPDLLHSQGKEFYPVLPDWTVRTTRCVSVTVWPQRYLRRSPLSRARTAHPA